MRTILLRSVSFFLIVAASIRPNALDAQVSSGRDTTQATRPPRARAGAQFRIPLASVIVPGLGQYVHGAVVPGLGFTATAVAGLTVSLTGNANLLDELPREAGDQVAFEGTQVVFTSGALSAWDAFQRAIPDLQREGKYGFLGPERPNLGSLMAAPLDMRFLRRWTTWTNLAYTGLVAGLVLGSRDDALSHDPFRARDAVFVSALSFNAAVGEEALFRGWLLPVLHSATGENFWLANGLQSAIFGVGHVGTAEVFALAITGWALYQGWLVRRNDWSVRESIFHHFWYDVAVATATLLADERSSVQLRFPPITF